MNKFFQFIGVLVTVLMATGVANAKKSKYKEIDVKNGSTIKGSVTWKGDIPTLPGITVFKHMD